MERHVDNPNVLLFDAIVRHQINLLRYSSSLKKKIDKLLNETESDILEKIVSRLLTSKGLSSPSEVVRLTTLSKIIKSIRNKAWDKVNKELEEELTDLAKLEGDYINQFFIISSPVVLDTILPSTKTLKAIVSSRPFEGKVLSQWVKRLQEEDLRRIDSAIRVGMVSGESSAAIARRVVGDSKLNGINGVTEVTRRQADAIIRTAINFISNEARAEFINENSDIIEKELFVATLDSRTSAVCRGYDGKTYDVGKGPRPPLHFRCRSLRIPILSGSIISLRPAKSSTEKILLREYAAKNQIDTPSTRDGLPKGMKGSYDIFARKRIRELTSRVPGATSYQNWLRTQTNSFQDEVLGKTKAILYRKGGLELDKFINRQGDELSLSALAKKYQKEFTLAGLDPNRY